MRDPIYTNEKDGVVLEVCSNISGVPKACIEPVWELLLLVNMRGYYKLVIQKKVQGASAKTNLVRVVGSDGMQRFAIVRFQSVAGACYQGTLSFRKDTSRYTETMAGSALCRTLQEKAGLGWFDPKEPIASLIRPPQLTASSTPLGSVQGALYRAVEPVHHPKPAPEPMKQEDPSSEAEESPSDEKEKIERVQFTEDQLRDMFAQLLAMSHNGRIQGNQITSLVTESLSSRGVIRSRRGVGIQIHIWSKAGLLNLVEEHGKVKIYEITQAAYERFGLTRPVSTIPILPPTPSLSAEPVPAQLPVPVQQSLTPVMMAALSAERMVEEFRSAQKKIEELELRKMEIEDELKKLTDLVADPRYKEAEQLLKSLAAFGGQR